ncbi:hypothetical protein [Brucella pituitosa]|uniref:hypothetical protein n=1 Tax=Brucella pituitosa TaxID=571256 RepID=UPI003F4AA706
MVLVTNGRSDFHTNPLPYRSKLNGEGGAAQPVWREDAGNDIEITNAIRREFAGLGIIVHISNVILTIADIS